MVLGSLLMLISLMPVPFFRVPFFSFFAWSVGFEFFERRFLYKLIFIYSVIFVLIMFPFELAVLEGIDSVLLMPFIQGTYPMILTWLFWFVFFSVSILTQFVFTAFCSYITWQFAGKWLRRLPNYLNKVSPYVG